MSSSRYHSRTTIRAGIVLAAAVSLIASTAAIYPGVATVPGLSFRISSSTRISVGENATGQDDEIMRGRGVAAKNHARIELLAMTPLPEGVTLDDYLLTQDSGRVVVLHAKAHTYTPANALFGGPGVMALAHSGGSGRGGGGGDSTGGGGRGGAGRAGRGGGGGGFPGGGRGGRGRGRGLGRSFLDEIQLRDVKFDIEKLGAGEPIESRPTQHYRITADYKIAWGGQIVDAHAVSEIFTTTLSTDIQNPFEPLTTVEPAPDGPLIEYVLKLVRIRNQVEGVPIKFTTTTTLSNLENVVGLPGVGRAGGDNEPTRTLRIVQTTAITSIKDADVDEKQLAIPDGFTAGTP